jgi:hypothetical protein
METTPKTGKMHATIFSLYSTKVFKKGFAQTKYSETSLGRFRNLFIKHEFLSISSKSIREILYSLGLADGYPYHVSGLHIVDNRNINLFLFDVFYNSRNKWGTWPLS